MNLSAFNAVTCLFIAALCVWGELSQHTAKSFWLSCARALMAISSLIEGSWYAADQTIAMAQAVMNVAMAFLLLALFFNTQIEAVKRKNPAGVSKRAYIEQFALFWRW